MKEIKGVPVGVNVPVGIQSVLGYVGAGATALTPFIAWLLSLDMPENVTVVLYLVAGALAVITGKNRSDQAVAITRAHATNGWRVDQVVGPAPEAPHIEADEGDAGNVGIDGEPLIPDVEGES